MRAFKTGLLVVILIILLVNDGLGRDSESRSIQRQDNPEQLSMLSADSGLALRTPITQDIYEDLYFFRHLHMVFVSVQAEGFDGSPISLRTLRYVDPTMCSDLIGSNVRPLRRRATGSQQNSHTSEPIDFEGTSADSRQPHLSGVTSTESGVRFAASGLNGQPPQPPPSWETRHLTSGHKPEYREETVRGRNFDVGTVNGIEVWTRMGCNDRKYRRLAADIFVLNESGGTIRVVPAKHVHLEFAVGDQRLKVPTISADEVMKKKRATRRWVSALLGAVSQLSVSRSSGSYSGSFHRRFRSSRASDTLRSGPPGRVAPQSDINIAFRTAIEAAVDHGEVELLCPSTLSPGEATGGRVDFRHSDGAKDIEREARLTVSVGSEYTWNDLVFTRRIGPASSCGSPTDSQ